MTRIGQQFFFRGRVLVWFSCGAASAVAAKLALEEFKSDAVEVLYCEVANEHPDNARFRSDCEKWLGVPIIGLRSEDYPSMDIYDVFAKERYIAGVDGARCTRVLKRDLGREYRLPEDTNVFGYTVEESERARQFERNNPGVFCRWILEERGITKSDCYKILQAAGLILPVMYLMGYRNNNCLGCVKGGAGYWNKIRVDFPTVFDRMAEFSRSLGVRLLKQKGGRIFLDELQPGTGRYEQEEDFECGPICMRPTENGSAS